LGYAATLRHRNSGRSLFSKNRESATTTTVCRQRGILRPTIWGVNAFSCIGASGALFSQEGEKSKIANHNTLWSDKKSFPP
jgi:hypothetical protein